MSRCRLALPCIPYPPFPCLFPHPRLVCDTCLVPQATSAPTRFTPGAPLWLPAMSPIHVTSLLHPKPSPCPHPSHLERPDGSVITSARCGWKSLKCSLSCGQVQVQGRLCTTTCARAKRTGACVEYTLHMHSPGASSSGIVRCRSRAGCASCASPPVSGRRGVR